MVALNQQEITMTTVPDEWDARIDQSYYKIGVHGLAFMWIDNAWQRTTKKPEEIEKHTKRNT